MRSKAELDAVTIRPRRHLLGWFCLAAIAIMVPVVITLLRKVSLAGVAFLVIVLASAVVMYLLFRRARLTITPTGSAVTPFLGPTHSIDAAEIGGAILVEMHRTMTIRSRPQLFILDADEHLLLRMRGEYWHRADIHQVIDSMDIETQNVPEPVTLSELQETVPHLLYWFERRPNL